MKITNEEEKRNRLRVWQRSLKRLRAVGRIYTHYDADGRRYREIEITEVSL